MERLTLWNDGYHGICHDKKCDMFTKNCQLVTARCEAVQNIIDRLAHYEDLEEQGRLVVLPPEKIKRGDTVYVIGTQKLMECSVSEICFGENNSVEYLVFYRCGYECDGCPFGDWYHNDALGENRCYGEWDEGRIKSADFGKTVFLSRAEAEAALAHASDVPEGGGV